MSWRMGPKMARSSCFPAREQVKKAAWSCTIDCTNHCVQGALNTWPARRREYNDGYAASFEVLLMLQIQISSQQHLDTSFFSGIAWTTDARRGAASG